MCTNRECLKFFCDTCPVCPAGSCNDANHDQDLCWNHHHPPWARSTGIHNRCSLEDEEFVRGVLYCESDPDRQKALHKEDQEALWFIAELGPEILAPDRQLASATKRHGILHATRRLNTILANGSQPGGSRRLRFPAVVSFVGETGAGKSTLIRAVIEESRTKAKKDDDQQPRIEMPVVQCSSAQSLTDPTSSGVHLYKDPGTIASSNPILFADCEGFNAGGTSAASFPQDLLTDPGIVAKFPITASSYLTSLDVEDLYAKSLYTFSDTVCFVINNAQTVGLGMARLLCWAVTGFSTAVHVVPQKTLILVLNAPRSEYGKEIMDEENLRGIFLGGSKRFWEDYPLLNDIRKKAFGDNPVTAEMLLRLCFSKISVFYIPNGNLSGAHPGDIRLQVRKLHAQIKDDVELIADIRHDTWTQYNEMDFTRLFYLALEHFATTNKVFNFFEASKSSSLDHRGLEDHILAIRKQFPGQSSPDRFPAIVASALVNKVLREDIAS